ncbi:alpha/beta hydrolase [Isoptericola chiayiensis]|uniref:Alpha/beta hydrolase n=1 Tax=Isoptericola chiayiensis TaxID=579446 RepID=A0ABP8YJX6_9MICO|nr:alpha/beta hydrolase [Isoptericola chiayiensis]NOW00415.1 pimeloyl-ACP methyl ester carboxylesterase [Isoptericola chiayiensis]
MVQQQSAGPRHVTSKDGVRLAVWSTGTGPPLLLVHGSMSDHRRWRITEHLSDVRTVHAMDRRGRGGSTDGPDWTPEREVEDVVAVVEAVAADAGHPADVLGHSFGGYLAVRAAARTAQVRRLVLYEPAVVPHPQPPELVARVQAAVDAGRSEDAVEIMLRDVLHMPEEEITMLRAQPSWPARVATAPTLPREESVPLLLDPAEAAAVRAPTLLIRGGDSPEFLQDAIRTVAGSVPDCRVVTLEGQQHVADQTDPEGFARVVREFLRY